MPEEFTAYYHSPIGTLEIVGNEHGLLTIGFVKEQKQELEIPGPLKEAYKQLDEYFKGDRRAFDLPLLPEGTGFQKRVWNELVKIPCGQTISYRELAVRIGNEKAVRAVGSANGKNPLSIVIPCHRVIGSDGSLTGYGGGLDRKKWLLIHEGVLL